MKKLVSLLLLLVMLFSVSAVNASADDDITLKFLIASGFYDLEKDLGVLAAKRVAGYNIEYEQLNGTQQLMLIISSGQAYDYVYLKKDTYNLMMSEGALMDITDLLNEHGQEILAAFPTTWPATTVDGRIYAIPSPTAQPKSLPNSMIARTDLLAAIGITEYPTTLPAFVKMLEDIKVAYPDMIPLTAASGWLFSNIASVYNVTGMYQLLDGKVTALVDHPNLKAYVETMRDLYARGLLDVEMPALTKNDMRAKFSAGKAVISYQGWNGCETGLGALRELVPGMSYDVLPLLEDENGKVHAEMNSGVTAYGAIPVTAEHPAEAIQAINNMIQIDNFYEIALGVEGVHYERLENGRLAPIQPAFNNEKINSNVLVSGFYREVEYPGMWEVRLAKNADLQGVFYKMRDSLLDGGVASPVSLAPAVTVIDNTATLETKVTDTLIAIIAGTQGIEELETLKDYWHKNGGEELMEFYNEWYAEVMAK